MATDRKATRGRVPVETAVRTDAIALTWLSDYVALARAPVPARPSKAQLVHDAGGLALRVTRIPLAAPDAGDSLLVVHGANGDALRAKSGALTVATARGRVELGMTENGGLPVGAFAAEHLGDAPRKTGEALLEELLPLLANERGRHQLAESLHALRDSIRQPLAAPKIEPGASSGMAVDAIWRLDVDSFYVEGWLRSGSEYLDRVVALTPEGRGIDFLETVFRYPRIDVADFFGVPSTVKLGFISFLELPEPSVLESGWLLQAHFADGHAVEVAMPTAVDNPEAARATILADIALETSPSEELRGRHIRPALERVQRRLAADVRIDVVDQHGTPPSAPTVSVIVPLYRRLEFLEHQMSEFVHDPEFEKTDLIYVLDSPDDAAYLRRYARHLHRLYRVPFRLAVLTKNGGYSAVNNLGASLASGRLLLLLNSDVLPARPGWLARLAAFHDANPRMGAVAPKLLYEDDSIQHGGLYFDRPEGTEVWSNEHYFKGLRRDFLAANVARRVPAVTGAALMIAADLFREVGGLRGEYIRGDYEDSDLCLRLRESGREIWYLPDVELYHLEGQSYPTEERLLTSEYNKWLHTHVWRDRLDREVQHQ